MQSGFLKERITRKQARTAIESEGEGAGRHEGPRLVKKPGGLAGYLKVRKSDAMEAR
jgi:hypothetical protein